MGGAQSGPFGRLWLFSLKRLEGSQMPHFPKPFLKKGRGVWYAEINRRQISLGSDKDEAFRQYHRLMTQHRLMPALDSSF